MALPVMAKEDRDKALANAQKARIERAALLRRLTAGELTVAQIFEMADTDESVARIKITSLVKALPRYGDAKTTALLKDLDIAESRRLKGVGFKQRAALIERLDA